MYSSKSNSCLLEREKGSESHVLLERKNVNIKNKV